MIIRSQNKKSITTDLNINIYADDEEKEFELINKSLTSLGTYSTEEKAIKVLDMIEKLYVESVWTEGKTIIANRVCFEMPQDSEV
jgi:hypothetical protein